MADLPLPTVVIGTAGHIDHGKTTLLRALTGIDADRLPEERARGMTIDVGFAHLDLEGGGSIDFVDVPGHDRLVGNMLVGAGEIDAVLLVVAADDGPRAQTREHLELLDALGLRHAVVALTKVDLVDESRASEVAAAVRSLVDRCTLRGAPLIRVSGATGEGLGELRGALVPVRDAVTAEAIRLAGPLRLPIDRVFTIRGRGTVLTGTLRGGPVRAGTELRLEPREGRRGGPATVRVREVQVHHGRADAAVGGRAALNISGAETSELRRGQVLTGGEGIAATDRVLAALQVPVRLREGRPAPWPPEIGADLRLHVWTDSVEARIGPIGGRWADVGDGTVAAIVRLARPVAALEGARAVLRDPGSGRVVAGLTILDLRPPRGVSRRRASGPRLVALAEAVRASEAAPSGRAPGQPLQDALVDLHGLRRGRLADDVRDHLVAHAVERAASGVSIADLRASLGDELRRLVTVPPDARGDAAAAVGGLVDSLVDAGRLARDGERLVEPGRRVAVDDALASSMARLEAALDAAVPPALGEAARAVGCPPAGLRSLEAAGRIVRVDDDLAWAADRYATLRDLAISMARRTPLTPAALRDAIGGNRRVVMPLLDDLGRKGFLRRTEAGHVPGPRA